MDPGAELAAAMYVYRSAGLGRNGAGARHRGRRLPTCGSPSTPAPMMAASGQNGFFVGMWARPAFREHCCKGWPLGRTIPRLRRAICMQVAACWAGRGWAGGGAPVMMWEDAVNRVPTAEPVETSMFCVCLCWWCQQTSACCSSYIASRRRFQACWPLVHLSR